MDDIQNTLLSTVLCWLDLQIHEIYYEINICLSNYNKLGPSKLHNLSTSGNSRTSANKTIQIQFSKALRYCQIKLIYSKFQTMSVREPLVIQDHWEHRPGKSVIGFVYYGLSRPVCGTAIPRTPPGILSRDRGIR